MAKGKTTVTKKRKEKKPSVAKVRAAVAKLAGFGFLRVVRQVDGCEAHIIMPAVAPIFPSLILIAEAAEAGMLQVKG